MKPVKIAPSLFAKIVCFYRDGFREMILGRTLWKIIAIKLLIMFCILKLFFFQGFLKTKFNTDNERAAYVMDQMTRSAATINTPKEVKKND